MRLLQTNVRTCAEQYKVTVKVTNGKNRKYEMDKHKLIKLLNVEC